MLCRSPGIAGDDRTKLPSKHSRVMSHVFNIIELLPFLGKFAAREHTINPVESMRDDYGRGLALATTASLGRFIRPMSQ